jgi:hypothetical protein
MDGYRIYKIPDGKGENAFAFSGEAKNKKYATEIIHECHEAWRRLVAGETPAKTLSYDLSMCVQFNLVTTQMRTYSKPFLALTSQFPTALAVPSPTTPSTPPSLWTQGSPPLPSIPPVSLMHACGRSTLTTLQSASGSTSLPFRSRAISSFDGHLYQTLSLITTH